MRPRHENPENGVRGSAWLCLRDGNERRLARRGTPAHLEIGEASIDVSFDSGAFDIDRAVLLDSVMQSARAATAYFSRFPVTDERVRLLQSSGGAFPTG